MKSWLALIRPGDWLVLLGSAVLVGFSIPVFWQGGMADRAYQQGERGAGHRTGVGDEALEIEGGAGGHAGRVLDDLGSRGSRGRRGALADLNPSSGHTDPPKCVFTK